MGARRTGVPTLVGRARRAGSPTSGACARTAAAVAGGLAAGLVVGRLLPAWPLALLALCAPVLLLLLAWRRAARRAEEALLLAGLDAGALAARTADQVTTALVTATGAALDADAVLLVCDPVDGDPAPAVTSALASAGPVRGSSSRELLVALRAGERTDLGERAVPVLRLRRSATAPPFCPRDLRRLAVLAGVGAARLREAERVDRERSALLRADRASEAARALGELGAGAGPALVRLRVLADRLDAVADVPGSSAGIVRLADELRGAERVVASLAGAVALHADPELSGVTQQVAAQLEELDEEVWTTTGSAAAFTAEPAATLPDRLRRASDRLRGDGAERSGR